MITKVVSCKTLLSRINRVYKPAFQNWTDEAIESIGEGLQILGYSAGFERKQICIDVEDYKGVLPCEVEHLEGVLYNGQRLLPNDALVNYGDCVPTKYSSTNWYLLNSTFIKTSFQTGKLTIICLVYPVDCDGFPMIPDNALAMQALSWIILRDLCLGGLSHPELTFQLCEQMWDKYYPKARNDMNFPSIESIEKFKKHWTRLIKSDSYNRDYFYGTGLGTNDNRNLVEFKDNAATIVHIDNDDDDLILSEGF